MAQLAKAGRGRTSSGPPLAPRQGDWLDRLLPYHYRLIAPALVATLAVIVVPLIYAFGLSLYHYVLTDPMNIHFAGLANYQNAFRDPAFASALRTTLVYSVGTVGIQFVLGMAFAYVTNKLTRGAGLIRTAMLIPMFSTPAVVAFMWRFMLHPDLGIVNYMLRGLGLGSPLWLGDVKLALGTVMAVDIWRNTPFMFLVFLAGMQSLPTEYYEAAAVDGSSAWQSFWHITLPLLKPLILVALIIRGMDALREFDTIFILTGGGPGNATETIALATYRYSFRAYDMGIGSAASYVIFIVAFLLSLLFMRQMQKAQVE